MTQDIDFDDIVAARRRGQGVVDTTPTLPSPSLSRITRRYLWFKAENLQRTGSFKIRGAMNASTCLTSEQRSRGVVAASDGNHAQGVARAAAVLTTSAMWTTVSVPTRS